MHLTQRGLQHLFLRAGFGISYDALQEYKGRSSEEIVNEIFENSSEPQYLNLANREDFLPLSTDQADTFQAGGNQSKDMIMELNAAWLKNMAVREGNIREKMTLFWHGHFASVSENPYLMQCQNNLIREHALGSFRDLLKAVMKDTVMLQNLNEKENTFKAPNENFARALLELFTLGKDQCTDKDIHEVARAFTGWKYNEEGEYEFSTMTHDYGEKTVLGSTGAFEGDDVLEILLKQKQTAKYIVEKVFKYFVNEEVDEYKITALSEKFFASDYDISVLLKEIFISEWFYERKNIGTRIKSPIELIATNMHVFRIEFDNPEVLVEIQELLGQVLFRPPSVTGWPAGQEWIDASTLLMRLRLMEAALASARLNRFLLADVEDGSNMMERLKELKVKLDWQSFKQQFNNINFEDIENTMIVYLLQNPISREKYQLLTTDRHSPVDERMFSIIAKVSKLPEFQLC